MKRTIGAILFVIYAIIAITVTVLLLSFNDYNCSEIGEYTVYIVKDDSLEPEYKQGSILLIKETSDKHVQVGDEIFLYKVINSQEYEFVNRTLENKLQQGKHIVYEVEQDEQYDNAYFVGKADDTIVIKGWGTLLSILESKWGYLFCIVIVSLLLFLQEVFDLIIELKYGGTKGTKAANAASARKSASKTSTTRQASTAKKTTTATKTATTKASTTAKTATTKATTSTKAVEKAAKANSAETGEKEG